jgi:glycosyltransferase involved in cell wall biosynthesis
MNNPKITVLMPVYNEENFLREAIDSILNQTFKDFEFIIINDGSTDNSKNIILSYRDPRIRYYENRKNLGVAKTLNRGLRLAKGEYIARMDADDISLPNRLELQYERIKRDKNLVIISSHFDWIDEKGNYYSTFRLASSPEEIFYELQFRNCLGHSTVIFNKKIIVNEFGGYDERYEDTQDNDLWLRVSKKYKIVKLDKVLMKIRGSKQSMTVLFRKAVNENAIIAQNNLQSLIRKPIDSDVIRILADINPLSYSPKKIKEALIILEKVNIKILEYCPLFLDKSIINKSMKNKKNWLKLCLLTATLFDSKFGFIFKFIYKVYKLTKYQFNS